VARYPLGQPVRLNTTVLNSTVDPAVPIDAGSLTLAVRKPDLSQQVYNTPAHDGVGLYHQDVPAADLTQLGHYQYVWVATGAGAGVSGPNEFDVYDPFQTELLSVADAKQHLNIATSSVDAELQGFIDASTAGIERHLGGPAIIRTVTEQIEQPIDLWRSLPLTYRPFVALTSITAGGQSVAITDVYVTPGRVLRRKFGLPFVPFWAQPWVITYTAGLDVSAPPSVVLACKVIVAHLWATQRGQSGGRGPGANNEYGSTAVGTVAPGFGFAIPNRALELLNPYAPETGVA